jgi:Fe-S-cluster containining protein
MRMQNRKALQAFHPHVYSLLETLLDSPFEAETNNLLFLGRTWPFGELAPVPLGSCVIVFGLPHPTELAKILNQTPERVLIVDSQIEKVWALMMNHNYEDLLKHPCLYLAVNTPEKLLIEFPELLYQFRDLQNLEWRESQPATELAERMGSVFLLQGFRPWQEELAVIQPPEQLKVLTAQLYQELLPATETAYKNYALSCSSGCAQCCHKGVSALITVTPGEWLVLWESFLSLPEKRLKKIAKYFRTWVGKEQKLLLKLLGYFAENMQQSHTSDFSLKHLELLAPQHNQACFLLDSETQTCLVYPGRPLTCRLFGASHFYGSQPYTCEIDWEQHEHIILHEGKYNHLVKADIWREELQSIHKHYPFKMPLALWFVTHLASDGDGWIDSPRLDYAQFKELLRLNEEEGLGLLTADSQEP